MQDSIFTKIIKRNVPAEIVFENEELMAIKDINPQAPVHLLIFPKQQIASTNDLVSTDSQLVANMLLTAVKLAKEFDISEAGYRLVMNCGEAGGQTVPHIHCHLLGGKSLKWEF